MLETIIFILTHAAVLYVMFWIIQNDRLSSIDEQTGYLRMSSPGQAGRGREKRGVRQAAPNRRRHPK